MSAQDAASLQARAVSCDSRKEQALDSAPDVLQTVGIKTTVRKQSERGISLQVDEMQTAILGNLASAPFASRPSAHCPIRGGNDKVFMAPGVFRL